MTLLAWLDRTVEGPILMKSRMSWPGVARYMTIHASWNARTVSATRQGAPAARPLRLPIDAAQAWAAERRWVLHKQNELWIRAEVRTRPALPVARDEFASHHRLGRAGREPQQREPLLDAPTCQ